MRTNIFWGPYFQLFLIDTNSGIVESYSNSILIFEGTFMLFTTAMAPSHISTNGAQGFQGLHILANAYFFIIALLMGMKW